MSTVKQFVFEEQIAPVNGVFIYAQKFNQSINNYEPTATQNSTAANQGDWTIPSTAGVDFYKSKFSNWSYSDASKNIKVIWTQGSASGGSVPVIADYRTAHPTYNTSASKCKITFYNLQMRIGGLVAISNTTGYVIKYTVNYTALNNQNTFTLVGPIEISDTIPAFNQTASSSIDIPYFINFPNLPPDVPQYIQQGSLVTGGAKNDIDGLEYNLRVDKISGSPRGSSVNISPALFSSNVIRQYECNLYKIDGVDGDSPPTITNDFNLICNAGLIRSANVNLQADCSLSENSVSVITGVEKTLENNFSLSAAGRVKYAIGKTLTQETELLGTTFNFRFMEPLTVQSRNTTTAAGSIKRNFATSLSLSNESTANFTGNMIYDIAADYIWDDFSIIGYFVTGYTVRGYATDSAEYAWTDLGSDPWDAWTYSSWQGLETGWDQWPEDLWDSTKKISFDFDMAEVGNIKRSGVSQLLSTTALSENAAKLKTGASTVRSDFLCDGSPSGKIGGSSTVISDAVLTALGNYIINNAQNINGAFNASLLANYIAKFLWSVRSDFSLTVNPRFKPSGVTNAQCITVVNALANAKYGPNKTLQGAFDPEFIARLFVGTDPYLIHKILQETRQIFVDAESRGIQIAEEIRLNSIPAEDRDHLVPQETRSMKLRIPPMTNRFTTPKVRTE